MHTKNGNRDTVDYTATVEKLKAAGFAATDLEGSRVRISKHGCAAVLEKSATGEPLFIVRPGILMGENIAHLLDRGFQKFWQAGERLVPAVSAELKALHCFDQELRAVLGLTDLYNQSLGTVSARYVYDRVEGREGPRVHQTFD